MPRVWKISELKKRYDFECEVKTWFEDQQDLLKIESLINIDYNAYARFLVPSRSRGGAVEIDNHISVADGSWKRDTAFRLMQQHLPHFVRVGFHYEKKLSIPLPDYEDHMKWIRDHCKGLWMTSYSFVDEAYYYRFSDNASAVLFKLRWG